MFMARNKMILGTSSSITFRGMIDSRYLIATNFVGNCIIIGENLELSTDESEWTGELINDFGTSTELIEFPFWVRPSNGQKVGKIRVEQINS